MASREWTACLAAWAACSSGCASTPPAHGACAPPPAAEFTDLGAAADRLAGTYAVTLVATEGERRGRAASARLTLVPRADSLRRFDGGRSPGGSAPVYGWAELDVEGVGGLPHGSVASRDPRRPGVEVVDLRGVSEGRPFRELTLRLGADANRRDVISLDGPYTALEVTAVGPGGFGGLWHASLGMTTYRAGGHFCAERLR